VLRALLTVVATLLASVPAAASATPLALRDTGLTPTTVRGDGAQRLATSVDGGPVSVLDTRTRSFSTIPTPPGCAFADIHHATVLWNCPSQTSWPSAITYEITTGRLASLPPLAYGGGEDGARYAAIGDRFARIAVQGYHYSDDASVYVERASGHQRYEFRRFGLVRDLDAPGLTRMLCAGHLEPEVEGGIGLEPGEPVVAGRWMAAVALSQNPAVGHERDAAAYIGRVLLQRCGAKARTLRVCRAVDCSMPVLDDRIVAWTERRGRGPTTTRLVVRRLRSGRVRRTPWQALGLRPVLVDHRLYVHEQPSVLDAAGSGRGRLLRAAL
jgi:hypothetical protein